MTDQPPKPRCSSCSREGPHARDCFTQKRVYDPSTGWEGTIEEFARAAAASIRKAAHPELGSATDDQSP